jgi:hypothetical protein
MRAKQVARTAGERFRRFIVEAFEIQRKISLHKKAAEGCRSPRSFALGPGGDDEVLKFGRAKRTAIRLKGAEMSSLRILKFLTAWSEAD